MKRIFFSINGTCYSWFVLASGGLIYTITVGLGKRNFFTEEINNSGKLAQKIAEQAQEITEQIYCNTIQIKII